MPVTQERGDDILDGSIATADLADLAVTNVKLNLVLVWRDVYSPIGTYARYEIVSYFSIIYICIASNNSGNQHYPTDTSYWTKIFPITGQGYTWKGSYSSGTAYSAYDCISYNGSAYICILSSTGNNPTNATYWSLLALKGDTGATGAKGDKGDTGTNHWLGEFTVDPVVAVSGDMYFNFVAPQHVKVYLTNSIPPGWTNLT
jgi:hypothetical protein